jgi:hypothetical protein
MPDKRGRQKQVMQRDWLGPSSRRLRLYSDEDISARMVDWLKSVGVNVLSTIEAGNSGKDDSWQATYAARKRRVLLTHNDKHFSDERRLPMNATLGVIALDVDRHDSYAYLVACTIVSELLVPWAEIYERMKIRVTSSGASFRFIERGTLRSVPLTLEQLLDGRYPTDGAEAA